MESSSQGTHRPRLRPVLGARATTSGPEKSSSLSASAPEFIPKSKTESHQPWAGGDSLNNLTPVEKLKQLINALSYDPASYEQNLEKIAEGFGTNVKDDQTLIDVVDELVNQSIAEANFRYTGARICQAFSTDLKAGFSTGNFRQYLMKRVHVEHAKREQLVATDKHYLTGLMMFVGELLLHMRVGEVKQRIEILSTAVLELATTCLNRAEEDTVKSTVQLLKLTGVVLHHMEKQRNADKKTPKLDAVISALKDIVADGKFSREMRQSVLKVIEDRATWDSQPTEDPVLETSAPTHDQKPFTNEPTFYSVTGEVISEEEAVIAHSEYAASCGHSDYAASCALQYPEILPPAVDPYADFDPNEYEEELEQFLQENAQANSSNEWDDEIASAYELFLQNQENETHHRLPNGT